MIGRRSKILIFFYMIFLIILFLMCSTDLIIREPEKEVYQISVIIEDVRDDNYGNFRRGMDQAAIECNADVHFITLYEKMDAGQQIELINREEQDGTDALIVVPVDEESLIGAVGGGQANIPLVVLGMRETEEKTAGAVCIDYEKMGGRLAEGMKKHISEGSLVLLLKEPDGQSYMSGSFLEGAEAALKKEGYRCRTVEPEGEEDYKKMLEELQEKEVAVLAGSPEGLTKVANILAEDPALSDRVAGLYGRGNTLQILNGLDEGLITGICVTDEFSRGYFSVSMAVQMLDGKSSQEPLWMDSYYIEKEDLREPKYEKILFPME